MNCVVSLQLQVDAVDKNGHSPLFFAVDNNKPLVAFYLIMSGANLMAKDAAGGFTISTFCVSLWENFGFFLYFSWIL